MFRHRKSSHGFTLIELIGVMAIAAILASALAPRVFDDIKRARQDQEAKTLATLRGNLETYILETKRIPAPALNTWSSALAQMSSLPQAKVSTNERGYRRGYYVDPRFFSATDTAFTGYTQQTGLTAAPVSPRIMLVSRLSGHAPAAPTTQAAFNAIWDQSTSATLLEGPDVRIERLNLRDMFHRMKLSNENSSSLTYRLEAGTVTPVTATPTIVSVLGQTRVDMLRDGTLNKVFIVSSDHSFTYGSDGTWQQP